MHKTAKSIYQNLEGNRYQYVDRARQCSKLTIPYVMPDEGFGPHSRLETPFQGIGARGVNNLASKLLLALLPPNAPFFRLNIDTYQLRAEGSPEELISEIETSLQQVEEAVMDEISRETYRTGIHEALKHLIITGNALLYLPDDGGMRVFHLDRFVVKRDPMGNVTKIATKENIAYSALAESVQQAVGSESDQDTLDLYTSVCRENNKWRIQQDVEGVTIMEGVYDIDKNPFIPLRFSRVDGEDYGRS